MGRKEKLQQEINERQQKINILNGVPEDRFTFGTVLRFASNGNTVKQHLIKVAEENWENVTGGEGKDLASWILEYIESGIGYFEVYELRVHPAPFYSSPT